MTSQWDTFGRAWNELIDEKTPNGRKWDILESIRDLIQELHDLDHATDHKSTIQLFKSKSLQMKLKILDCKHYKDKSLWMRTKDPEMFECICGLKAHRHYIKERYGYDLP